MFMTRARNGARCKTSLCIALCVGLGASTSAMSQENNQESNAPFTMGYSAGFLAEPFQALLVAGAMEAAAELGISTLPATNANADPAKQLSDVSNLIAAGAQGLILVPYDAEAIVPALNMAEERNVRVVAIDDGPSGGNVSMIVRADNYKMAEENCHFVAEKIGGSGKVLMLMGALTDLNGRDRADGFADCMASTYPEIEVNAQPMYWRPDRCTSAAQTVVSTTPDLKAIYMASDVICLPGVLEVLRGAGRLKPAGDPERIVITAIDGSPFAHQKIREGELDATVSQPLEAYAKYGVEYLRAAVNGEVFEAGPTDHGSEIIDFNGNLMDLLPAPLVTKENVDDPALWGNRVNG